MKRIMSLMLIASLLTGITGCGYGPWATKIAAFSTIAPAQIESVSAAYPAANNVHVLSQEAVLVDEYAKAGYHPDQIKPFLSDKDMRIRLQALDALKKYTILLNDIASGREEQRFKAGAESSVRVMSTSSGQITTPGAHQRITFSDLDMYVFLNSLDIVIESTMHIKIKHRLPTLIAKADPYIQELADLFRSDLNTLRNQDDADYDNQLLLQDQFIDKNMATMSPVALRREIINLVTIQNAKAKNDKDLNDALSSIEAMSSAHSALANILNPNVKPVSTEQAIVILNNGLAGLKKMYWEVPVANRGAIADTEKKLDILLTQMNQKDISDRGNSFTVASADFNTQVLPSIIKLQSDMSKEVDRYLIVKDVLEDLEKVEQMSSFFTIPRPPQI
jgi:hypothetical protein